MSVTPITICLMVLINKLCVEFSQGALGHSYVAEVEKHSSQTDAAKGFGGKFGVQKDRVDKVRNSLTVLHLIRN